MNDERAQTTSPSMEATWPDNGAAADEHPSPLTRVHRLLRGRYHWAVVLALLGAGTGAALGYLLPKPEYRSSGLIRVRPVLPRVIYPSEESSVMPRFEAFLASQAELIGSSRVIEMATSSERWRALQVDGAGPTRDAFRAKLDVTRPHNADVILISFWDRDPEAARVAVNAVIDAYLRIYGENDVQSDAQRLRLLEERGVALSNQLAGIRERINTIASEYGADGLNQALTFKLDELHRLERVLGEAELAASVPAAVVTSDPATIEQISAIDPRLRQLLTQRQSLEQRVALLHASGFGAKHDEMVRAREQLDLATRAVSEHLQGVSERPNPLLASAANGQPALDPQRVRSLYEQRKTDAQALAGKKRQIDMLRGESDMVEQRLKDTRFRIEQLNVESALSERIELVSRGDKPSQPARDRRRQMALAGGGGGALAGLGLVILIGLMDRRVLTLDAARTSAGATPLLGILPDLPEDLSDPEQALVAAHAVHHVRTLLQIHAQREDTPVYAVTSSSAGAGKTSLTLALGLSFAMAGSRTLLIDSDLAGGGLSTRLEAIVRRRMGQSLVERGVLTAEQLETALARASVENESLSDALLALGYLREGNGGHVVALRERAAAGLLDVMQGRPLAEVVVETEIENLSILPLGAGRAQDASRVSRKAVAALIAEARREYDVVLFDGGPIPGSVEASVVAAHADAAVLVVSRGNHRRQTEQTIEFLRTLQTPIAGLVFNRADPGDFARSTYSSSLSTRRYSTRPGPIVVRAKRQDPSSPSARFGPIALAVTVASEEDL